MLDAVTAAREIEAKIIPAMWNGGLIVGALVLLLAAAWFALLFPELRDATREVPTLSPATVDAIELDEHRGQLIDVQGFVPDCDAQRFDGERMLVPAWSPDRAKVILIALEYGSECPTLAPEFRGVASAWISRSRLELSARAGWQLDERELAVVEPTWSPWSAFAVTLGLVGLGLFSIGSAFVRRKRLIAELHAKLKPRIEPVAPTLTDPYRPGYADRLITEPLRASVATLTKLRRKRALLFTLGVGLLGSSLLLASVGTWRIYEHERTWSIGVDGIDASPSGKSERFGVVLVRSDVAVAYVDDQGRHHRERVSAWSLIDAPDLSVVPHVRYRPEQPERFAVSWIHEQFRGSLILLIVVSAGLFGGGLGSLMSASRDRTHERTAAVFGNPREALLDLIRIDSHNSAGPDVLVYHFRVRDSVRMCTVVVGPRQVPPLFLDARESVGLALYNPLARDFLLVLSEDLHELEQPPFSAAQLRGRYRANPGLVRSIVQRRRWS